MTPLGNKILVKELPAEDRTKGGLIIPESAQKRPGRAKVVAVSADIDWEKDTPVIPGETVLYNPEAGSGVIHDGEDHLLITRADVWAKL